MNKLYILTYTYNRNLMITGSHLAQFLNKWRTKTEFLFRFFKGRKRLTSLLANIVQKDKISTRFL